MLKDIENMNRDISEITASFIETLNASHDEIHPDRLNFENIRSMVEKYVNFFEGHGYLSKTSENTLSAALLYRIVETDLKRYLYIQYYFSKNGKRRSGLVSQLVETAINYAEQNGIKEVSACVQDSNEASWRLITEKFGFVPLERYYIRGTFGFPISAHLRNDHTSECRGRLISSIIEKMEHFEGSNRSSDISSKAANIVKKYESSENCFILTNRNSGAPDFALCSVTRNFFKDYLSIDYYSLLNDPACILNSASQLSKQLGLMEVGINCHVKDIDTEMALKNNGFINVDTNYVKNL